MIKRSLFTPIDTAVFASGIVCITLGLYLYSHNSFDSFSSDLGKPVGQHLNGQGTQKNLGNLFWSPLVASSSVYNGDKLFANKNEDLSVKLLKSGLVINIPKESLVVIYEEQDGVSFSLDRGQIQILSENKNTKVRLRQGSESFKTLELKPSTDLQIKKSKRGNDVIVNKGEASVVGKNNKIESNVVPNAIVKINKTETIKIEAQDIIRESFIDLSKDHTLHVNNIAEGKVELLNSLDQKPVAIAQVSDGKIEANSLPVGEYFVREEGKLNYDKIKIVSSNSFIPRIVDNNNKVFAGEPLNIQWDGKNDENYKVSVITPDGNSKSLIAKGAYASIEVPKSGEYKVAITKADPADIIASNQLFTSDLIFTQTKKKVEMSSDLEKQTNGQEIILASKMQKLAFSQNSNVVKDYQYNNDQLKISIASEKSNIKQSGFNQQVSRTKMNIDKSNLEIYERSNLDKRIPALKKVKYDSQDKSQPSEELVLRYDDVGQLASLTFKEKNKIVEQFFENKKLVKSKEGSRVFSGESLALASPAPTTLAQFINSKVSLLKENSSKLQPNFSALDVKLVSPVAISSAQDLIDEKDNYIKKININKVNQQDYKYELENNSGKVIATSVLGTQLGLKNLPAGEYKLKVKTPDLRKEISHEKITIKPRVQLKTKPEDIDLAADKSFEVPLKWNSPANENKLEIFKEGSDTPIFSQVVSGNQFNYRTKSIDGLKWRVSAQIDTVMPSKTEYIEKPEPIKQLPVSGAVVMKYKKQLGGCYEFSLPKMKFAQKYFIEVYENISRDKMIFNKWLTENTLCWQSSKHGKYYYRYKYFDKWGAQSGFSEMGEIIFPISPLTEF